MKAKTVPRISETEWEVMRAIWAGHPASANEVIERLQKLDPTWHPKTAKTLLTRLVKKGALGFEMEGRSYVYRPLVAEADCVAVASTSFLDRVFGGSLQPMLAHFVASRRLTRRDLDELKRLLEDDSQKGRRS